MKNECGIVRDLLPLYIENMVSEDSREFIEEHLSCCAECKWTYLSMTSRGEEKISDEEAQMKILPLRLVKRKLLRKRIVTSVVAAVLSVAILLGSGILAYNVIDGKNKKSVIDLGTSLNYPLEDRQAAIEMIQEEWIYPLGFGYDVISIRFAGDAECIQYYLNEADRPLSDGIFGAILDGKHIYWKETDYMVFRVAMKTPAWGAVRGLKPDTFYDNIRVVFRRTEDSGEWLISYIETDG